MRKAKPKIQRALGLWCLPLLLVLLVGPHVARGGDPLRARELYQSCLKLKNDNEVCDAVKACEAGLAEHSSPTLKKLTEEVKPLCEALTPKRCLPGREKSEETLGNCCWPGQYWKRDACQGVPSSCPEHYNIDRRARRCRPKPCPAGQRHSGEGHCCWPGQRWSRSREQCIYQPRCPEGFRKSNRTCIPLGKCTAGKNWVSGGGCCWPGQTWSEANSVCEGSPACPPTHRREENECVVAAAEDQKDSDADGVPDVKDACVLDPEDRDGFKDADGCPDPDNDEDGILDAQDKCPSISGDDGEGCPAEALEQK